MEEKLICWFQELGFIALLLSLVINIVISILGVIPSVFITAANLRYFGFANGLILSIVGESLGAIITFYLYRKGINKFENKLDLKKNKYVEKLKSSKGIEAFIFILGLRIVPFIPSGVVTFAGAGSKMGLINFSIASTLGKLPALVIEAYSIYRILNWSWQGKVILCITSILIMCLFYFWKKHKVEKL